MSFLTVAWSMIASMGFLLGLMHFLIWWRDRQQYALLLASIMACAAGSLTLLELGTMTATSLEGYQTLVLWTVAATFGILVPMTWFVVFYLGTARQWLAMTITAVWIGALIVNFATPGDGNLVYTSITALRIETTFWGDPFVVADGVINPLTYFAHIASVIIVIFVADAALAAYRRGLQRKASIIGGSILFFIVIAGIHTPLVDTGLVRTPYLIGIFFVAITVAMALELVDQAVRAGIYGRELASWEKKWTTLLNEIQLAVVGLDQSGRINYVNPFFRDTSGFSQAHLLKRSAASLIPKSHRARFEKWLAEAPHIGPGTGLQFPLETASGDRREIVWSTVALRDGHGEYAGLLSIGEDISDRLQTHKELQQSQIEIEHLTRALIVGELGSTLAHELNQPLAAILSNAQAAKRLLKQGSVNLEDIQEILTDIVADDRRAGEVIDRMRTMLKKGKGTSEVFDLNDAIKEALHLVEGERKKSGTTIDLQLAVSPLMVSAGRVEIQQVIVNLVVNALRAVASQLPGDRCIQIETASSAGLASIAIEDSGPGVSKAVERRLFQPFFSTTSSGLGMGLAISRRIIAAHDGSIKLSKGKLGGARFEATIPLLAQLQDAVDA